jgi:hypothetical protein
MAFAGKRVTARLAASKSNKLVRDKKDITSIISKFKQKRDKQPFIFSDLRTAFQTSLVCIINKPCLKCKEALFAMQRSLVCKRSKF